MCYTIYKASKNLTLVILGIFMQTYLFLHHHFAKAHEKSLENIVLIDLSHTIHLTSRLLEPLLPIAVCHFQVQCFWEHTSISTVFLIMVTQVPPSVASYWLNALTWCHKPQMIRT